MTWVRVAFRSQESENCALWDGTIAAGISHS
jgi:hypothetical protein